MNQLLEQASHIADLFNVRILRERALALIAALLAPIIVADYFFFSQIRADIESFNASISSVQTDIDALDAEQLIFEEKSKKDPDQQSKDIIAKLRSEIELINTQLKSAELNLIQPKEMTQVLRHILLKNNALMLTQMHNLPPDELNIALEGATCKPPAECPSNDNIPSIYEQDRKSVV